MSFVLSVCITLLSLVYCRYDTCHIVVRRLMSVFCGIQFIDIVGLGVVDGT